MLRFRRPVLAPQETKERTRLRIEAWNAFFWRLIAQQAFAFCVVVLIALNSPKLLTIMHDDGMVVKTVPRSHAQAVHTGTVQHDAVAQQFQEQSVACDETRP